MNASRESFFRLLQHAGNIFPRSIKKTRSQIISHLHVKRDDGSPSFVQLAMGTHNHGIGATVLQEFCHLQSMIFVVTDQSDLNHKSLESQHSGTKTQKDKNVSNLAAWGSDERNHQPVTGAPSFRRKKENTSRS